MNTKLIKILSILIILLALVLLVYKVFFLNIGMFGVFSVSSVIFYCATGYYGLKLSKYELTNGEIRTVITRLIIGIICCQISFFLEGVLVLIISVVVFGFFYALKSNYDEWNEKIKERNNRKKDIE
jgi:hypothetical protein